MITPIVIPDGQVGYIFEGEAPQTFCFVPEACVKTNGGEVSIDEMEYVRSGWDLKNMRMSNAPSGNHLFPRASHPANDFETEPVKIFLDRIRALVPPVAPPFDASLPPPFLADPGIDPMVFFL